MRPSRPSPNRASAGSAVHKSRVRGQSKDRQDPGSRVPAPAHWPRRRGDRVKRREFITLLGGAAAAWPLAARAQQQGKSPVRLGFLPLGSPSNAYDRSLVEAFQQGLRRVGLIENRDIILDVAWVSGDPDQAVSDVARNCWYRAAQAHR